MTQQQAINSIAAFVHANKTAETMARGISDDERALLQHTNLFGSDGYPVRKLRKRGWVWGPWRSVKGPPTTFRTKREATESFERFLDVLRDATAGRI